MRSPTRPGTRSPALPMGLGGCCGPRSAIRRCSPHPTIRAGCSIALRMFKRIPVDKAQGNRRVALRSGKAAVALLLTIAGNAGVPAAELTFDIKIEHGRVPETVRLI